MMPLENQVVSLQYSKRLNELGVKEYSAFVWCAEDLWFVTPFDGSRQDGARISSRTRFDNINYAAFTVAELGEMLVPYVGQGLPRYQDDSLGRRWTYSWGTQRIGDADTEANARARLLIYLIEQGEIKIV